MTRRKTQISTNDLTNAYNEWHTFSCQPITKKIKIGTVLDEEKSVKWNREEVERINKQHDEEVKELNQQKNKLWVEWRELCHKYIVQEVHVTLERAEKIFEFSYNMGYGIDTMLIFLDDLLELFIGLKEK